LPLGNAPEHYPDLHYKGQNYILKLKVKVIHNLTNFLTKIADGEG
jgi:hypothetical protein